MRSSNELNHFFKFVNAVDVLDAVKNEVMVWISDEGDFEVDFCIFGKRAKASLIVEENDECALYLHDEVSDYHGTIVIACESAEEYTKLAERMVTFLHNPEGGF